MQAPHGHHHYHHGSNDEKSGINVAFFLNLGFTILEIIGGFFTNSVAILSDALHDLGDSLSLGLAWYFEKLAKKGRSDNYSYGYRRFSVLGAIINSIILILGSIFIIREAVIRLNSPEDVHAPGMFVLAIIGIVVNGIAVLRISPGNSLNARVVRLHLLEDVFGWAAILIGAGIMMIWPIPWIDPVLSIAISVFILYQVVRRLLSSLKIVMQAIPSNVDIASIKKVILAIPEVQSIHDPHIWTLDGSYHIFTVHVVVNNDIPREQLPVIKRKVREALRETDIRHITVELEFAGEDCVLVDC